MSIVKTKWIKLKFDCSLSEMIKRLRIFNFNPECGSGFEIINIKEERIEARFIERVVYKEIIEDPFGNPEHYEFTRYNIFKFYLLPLKKDRFLIVLLNPPRSLKPFVNALTNVLVDNIFVSFIDFDVLKISKALASSPWIANLLLRKVKVLGSLLEGRASAKIYLQSNGNVLNDLTEAFPNFKPIIEKASFQFLFDGKLETCELSSSGSLSIADHLVDHAVSIVSGQFD
jgi:hypothetical protein